MPRHDYCCNKCDHLTEKQTDFNPPATITCERCGQIAVRQIGLSNFRLKGSGWTGNIKRNKQIFKKRGKSSGGMS